jgi:protein arginine phosphatase
MMRILFVCTGNTCRSPLAEGMLRVMLQQENLQAEVRSAGVSAFDGGPISSNSLRILQEAGFQGQIQSNAIEREQVAWADLILTMTNSHKRAVIGQFPDAADKTFTLKEYVENDPNVLSAIAERNRLEADLQLRQALSQPITAEEKSRIALLMEQIPDTDISDPFGGPLEIYRATAWEIEQCLIKLVAKLKNG